MVEIPIPMGGLGLSLGFRARWKLSFTLFRCKVGTERCIDSPSTLTLLLRCQYYGYSDAVECCGPGLLFYVCFQLQSKALPISCLSWIMIRFLFLPSPSPAIQILRFSGWGKRNSVWKWIQPNFLQDNFLLRYWVPWVFVVFHSFYKLLIAKKVPTLRQQAETGCENVCRRRRQKEFISEMYIRSRRTPCSTLKLAFVLLHG